MSVPTYDTIHDHTDPTYDKIHDPNTCSPSLSHTFKNTLHHHKEAGVSQETKHTAVYEQISLTIMSPKISSTDNPVVSTSSNPAYGLRDTSHLRGTVSVNPMYITSEEDSEMAKNSYDVPKFESMKGNSDTAASARSAASTSSLTMTVEFDSIKNCDVHEKGKESGSTAADADAILRDVPAPPWCVTHPIATEREHFGEDLAKYTVPFQLKPAKREN